MLTDCLTGLSIYELTTPANIADSTVTIDILNCVSQVLSTFIADKGYNVKAVYNTVYDVYHGDCVIPLNRRNTKNPEKLPSGHPICEAGLAMYKDGTFSDRGRTRQKYCCPFNRSKSGSCPCNHKNWNNGKKCRGCTKYVTISDDYRLSIDRDCVTFKKIYALRSEAERYRSNRQVRNGSGFVISILQRIFVPFLILLCSRLLMQQLSLVLNLLTAV